MHIVHNIIYQFSMYLINFVIKGTSFVVYLRNWIGLNVLLRKCINWLNYWLCHYFIWLLISKWTITVSLILFLYSRICRLFLLSLSFFTNTHISLSLFHHCIYIRLSTRIIWSISIIWL